MFHLTCIGWLLFRADNFGAVSTALDVLVNQWSFTAAAGTGLLVIAFYAGILFAGRVADRRGEAASAPLPRALARAGCLVRLPGPDDRDSSIRARAMSSSTSSSEPMPRGRGAAHRADDRRGAHPHRVGHARRADAGHQRPGPLLASFRIARAPSPPRRAPRIAFIGDSVTDRVRART